MVFEQGYADNSKKFVSIVVNKIFDKIYDGLDMAAGNAVNASLPYDMSYALTRFQLVRRFYLAPIPSAPYLQSPIIVFLWIPAPGVAYRVYFAHHLLQEQNKILDLQYK